MPRAELCGALGCRYQGQLEALYAALEERQTARLRALKEGSGGTVAQRVTQVRFQPKPSRPGQCVRAEACRGEPAVLGQPEASALLSLPGCVCLML